MTRRRRLNLPSTGGSTPPSPPGPAARPAPGPAEPPRPAPPPARPAPESAQPEPATSQPARSEPEPARARPVPPAPVQPAAAQPIGGPGPAPEAAGSSAADTLRQNWDAVLDAVKRERRVAWILLSNASVLSVEDGILTLRFARDGDLKGFSTSGCDNDLKRVLSTGFGLNVMVKGVVGGDPGSGGGSARPGAGPGPGTAPLGRGPAAAAAPVPPVPAPEFAADYDEPPEDMPPDEDDLAPDDASPSDRASGPPELTGMDLIQRELGGQVIGEFEG